MIKTILAVVLVVLLAAAMPDHVRTAMRAGVSNVYSKLASCSREKPERERQDAGAQAEHREECPVASAVEQVTDAFDAVAAITDINPALDDKLPPARTMSSDEYKEVKDKLLEVISFMEGTGDE